MGESIYFLIGAKESVAEVCHCAVCASLAAKWYSHISGRPRPPCERGLNVINLPYLGRLPLQINNNNLSLDLFIGLMGDIDWQGSKVIEKLWQDGHLDRCNSVQKGDGDGGPQSQPLFNF